MTLINVDSLIFALSYEFQPNVNFRSPNFEFCAYEIGNIDEHILFVAECNSVVYVDDN